MPLYNKLQLAEQVHAISYSISFKLFLFFFYIFLILDTLRFSLKQAMKTAKQEKKNCQWRRVEHTRNVPNEKKKKRKLSLVSNQNKRHFSFFTYPLIKDEGKESDTVLLDHALFFVNK